MSLFEVLAESMRAGFGVLAAVAAQSGPSVLVGNEVGMGDTILGAG